MQGHLNAERTQLSVVQHFPFAMQCGESLGVDGLRVFLGVVLQCRSERCRRQGMLLGRAHFAAARPL